MEERKTIIEAIEDVCDENDCLHEQNNWLKKRNKCLQEEINNRENARIDCDAYVKKLLKERNELSERVNIDDLHIILAKYLTDNYVPEPAKICFFQFLDEIKKFIDSNKKEC